jgi:hypothetical protein
VSGKVIAVIAGVVGAGALVYWLSQREKGKTKKTAGPSKAKQVDAALAAKINALEQRLNTTSQTPTQMAPPGYPVNAAPRDSFAELDALINADMSATAGPQSAATTAPTTYASGPSPAFTAVQQAIANLTQWRNSIPVTSPAAPTQQLQALAPMPAPVDPNNPMAAMLVKANYDNAFNWRRSLVSLIQYSVPQVPQLPVNFPVLAG